MLHNDSLQAVFFSHPGDFTPVCTTELGEVARRAKDFAQRNVKVIGLSANGLEEHEKWVQDINEYGSKFGPTDVQFPIVSFAGINDTFPTTSIVFYAPLSDRRP